MRKINYRNIINQQPHKLGTAVNSKGQYVKFYENPHFGSKASVIGVIEGIAFVTGFYNLNNFYRGSDYTPVLLTNGTVVCEFEKEA